MSNKTKDAYDNSPEIKGMSRKELADTYRALKAERNEILNRIDDMAINLNISVPMSTTPMARVVELFKRIQIKSKPPVTNDARVAKMQEVIQLALDGKLQTLALACNLMPDDSGNSKGDIFYNTGGNIFGLLGLVTSMHHQMARTTLKEDSTNRL